MSGQVYSVTFTAGLIEKLAGIQRPSAKTRSVQQGPPRPVLHPELLALQRQDAALARALTSSQRVGNALLKQEEQEASKVNDLAADLLRQFNTPARPLPCQPEREACLDCYTKHAQDPLACAEAVDAYSRCASHAFTERAAARQAATAAQ